MLRVANKDTSLVSPINWYDFLDLICVKYVFKKCCPIVAAVARACWRTWQNKRKTLINAVNTIVVKLNHESNDQSSDERSKSHMTSVTMNSKGHKISDNSQGSMNGKQKRQHITTKKKKKKERENNYQSVTAWAWALVAEICTSTPVCIMERNQMCVHWFPLSFFPYLSFFFGVFCIFLKCPFSLFLAR